MAVKFRENFSFRIIFKYYLKQRLKKNYCGVIIVKALIVNSIVRIVTNNCRGNWPSKNLQWWQNMKALLMP